MSIARVTAHSGTCFLKVVRVGLLATLLCTFSAAIDNVLLPYRLRVDQIPTPLAVSSRRPMFSWALKSIGETRGLTQTGYRLIIARTVTGEKLMDTMRVNSSDTFASPLLIPDKYCGVKFQWSVEVWSNHAGSRIAGSTFETGLWSTPCWQGAQWAPTGDLAGR